MRRDASLKPSHKWRVLMLSSGELPIETKLNEDMRRGRAQAGHLVRAIDIVAKRALGAFDLPDIEFDPKAFADELKRVASTHYGAAGPEFVRHLIERHVTGEDVRRRVVAFGKDALDRIRDYHGQAARTAERFGLVAVAGELAIEFEIVPWVKTKPTEDAKELFAAWLEERGGAMPYETRQIVAQVRHFIEAHGDSRFDDITTPDPDQEAGRRTERAGDRARTKIAAGSCRRRYGATKSAPNSIRPRQRAFWRGLARLKKAATAGLRNPCACPT